MKEVRSQTEKPLALLLVAQTASEELRDSPPSLAEDQIHT